MSRKRRGRGEGSIYQRADGTWCATISVGYNNDGKRKRRTLFGDTKQKVQEKLGKLSREITHLSDIEPQRIKVGEYLDRWLKDGAKPRVRMTTFDNYERAVNLHIKPYLGGLQLARLTGLNIHGLYSTLEQAGKSPDTIRLTHAVLHRALRQAVKWRLIPFNTCSDVDRPKVEKKSISPYTVEQVKTLLTAAQGDRYEAIFVLGVTTGMRLGELFGLQWSDVNLAGQAIMVQHALVELRGRLTLTEPKTARGRRRIELPRMAIDALVQHQARMLEEGFAGGGYVFCNYHGGPLRRSHFHFRHFKPLLVRANLPEIRFHDLRHTSATLLLSQGVHPKVVQERLGHSQISVTMDTYSHVLPSLQLEAAGKFDQMLDSEETA
ncbi:Putative prophage phiRv2 integrase [Anatilimnocola aggregata]|uniref:Prophage phiRv2 integrase n=1 Tax=Anatilimnocola aggregata TaxID=2528021 RepID=A0A517YE56_9BACT|nr:site-specific integrase [Anatilimnocola aggregata]QDU28506.1 Putative prophage phiRv2 integrase [Anatilimnocola aggregata]